MRQDFKKCRSSFALVKIQKIKSPSKIQYEDIECPLHIDPS